MFRDQRGATAAEFALVLPIFLLFLLGLIDVGRYSWSVNQSEKATQIGTRWAVATDLVPAGLRNENYSFAVDGGIPQGTVVGTDAFGSVTCTSAAGRSPARRSAEIPATGIPVTSIRLRSTASSSACN